MRADGAAMGASGRGDQKVAGCRRGSLGPQWVQQWVHADRPWVHVGALAGAP